jgi:hypothetical protein
MRLDLSLMTGYVEALISTTEGSRGSIPGSLYHDHSMCFVAKLDALRHDAFGVGFVWRDDVLVLTVTTAHFCLSWKDD